MPCPITEVFGSHGVAAAGGWRAGRQVGADLTGAHGRTLRMTFGRPVLLMLLLACAATPTTPTTPTDEDAPPVAWHEWSPEAFAEARREGKHLLVSVQAAWCHWCHVMNDRTFGDPAVRAKLAADYIAIKVDSDARPDLAERFQDYAWPATVLLSPEADVVLPLRGYRAPGVFLQLLDDVRAGRETHDPGGLEAAPIDDLDQTRRVARAMLDRLYDERSGGWGARQKYPYGAPLEHAMFRAHALGERAWEPRVAATLAGHIALMDPVFGGIYQYSLPGRGPEALTGVAAWTRPHYEKITGVQADALMTFALGCGHGVDGACDGVAGIQAYLVEFLRSPEGGFYTSQDADLSHEVTGTDYYALDEAARRERGYPRVDRNVYTDLNARVIVALAAAHARDPNGTQPTLALALAAAEHVESFRAEDGLFRHAIDDQDAALRHLGDTAWMLRAELAVYEATGEDAWLERARRSAQALSLLRAESGALYAHTEDPAAVGAFAERRTPIALNGVAARGLLRLHRLDHDEDTLALALGALRGVADANHIRRRGRRIGEYVMALEELAAEHVLLSVVGPDDDATRTMHFAALAVHDPRAEVELRRPEQSRYPYPGRAAAYLCNERRCSAPLTDAEQLPAAVRRFLAAE